MLIAVLNQSTLVTDRDVYNMTLAVNYQVRHHVAPAWNMMPPAVAYVRSPPTQPGSAAIAVLDNSDQANALGWHTESAAGVIYGRVFAAPVLSNGGVPLDGALSVASVLSHEVIETFLDPACNRWADNGSRSYALEGCDAVESDSYEVHLGAGHAQVTASVSDFLLPPWFDASAAAGSHYDYLQLTSAPFQVRATGYTVIWDSSGINAVYGQHYPAWRKETKETPLARTSQRLTTG